MKKIVYGCAAILLSLGLLAGCNNEDDDEIIDPDPTIVDDDGPETQETYQVKLGAYYAPEGDNGTWYYCSGVVDRFNDIDTTTDWDEAPWITLTTVSGGVTLSFTDSSNNKQYIRCDNSGLIVNLSSEPFTWKWYDEYRAFAAYDELDEEDRLIGLDNNILDIEMSPISRGFDKFEVFQPLTEKPE